MEGIISSPRVIRAALLIGALAFAPLSASQARPSPDHTTEMVAEIEPETEHQDTLDTPEFVELFEPFNGPPRPIRTPPGAVDLAAFEPPIEETQVLRDLGSGVASYYGQRFHGRRTANGERFDMRAMTAAHRTLPFGTLVRVTNPSNGREVTVRINDRGPFIRGRSIDLSREAARKLGMISRGHARVRLEVVAP